MICLFGEDEVQLNPHESAWFSRDWDAVKKLADEFKTKPESDLFKILDNINSAKQPMSVEQFEGYSKFMIDKMLVQHIECVPAVSMANMVMQGLSDQHHHNYLMLTIPSGRRFSKSTKLVEGYKDKYVIQLLMKYYQVNSTRAFEYRELLVAKGKLKEVLANAKALATDEFLKTITKVPKEIKELKAL